MSRPNILSPVTIVTAFLEATTYGPFFSALNGLEQGPSHGLAHRGLAQQVEVLPRCIFVHDNLFTSLSLLHEMKKQGIGCIGMNCQ